MKNLNHSIARLKPTSIQDKILKAFLSNNVEQLPEESQIIFRRWEMVNDLIRARRLNDKNIVAMLQKSYGISKSQAYLDIADAKAFFGLIGRDQLEYKRGLYIEWLEEIATLARANDDFKTAVAAIDKAAEIIGLKEKTADVPDYAAIQPFIPVMVYDPKSISTAAAQTSLTDLRQAWEAKRKKSQGEDVDFEEI